jgi:hypothetical protein
MIAPSPRSAAVAGFAFAAAWAAWGLGWAALCLLCAALFALAAALARGELDLEDLRERADGARAGFAAPRRVE